tara:strand:- start:689 stop:802 length:114 start_codon:yes stop_codon:yes gene_type:complete
MVSGIEIAGCPITLRGSVKGRASRELIIRAKVLENND